MTPLRKPVSSFARLIKPEHKCMSRMLGYTLTSAEPKTWGAFSVVSRVRLSVTERAGLAVAALRSLPDAYALDTAKAAMSASGDPLPIFLGGMDDARSWAGCASRTELKAYALACFEAMSPRDQAAFYQHISEVEIAA